MTIRARRRAESAASLEEMNPFLLLQISSGDAVSNQGDDLTAYSAEDRKRADDVLSSMIEARNKKKS